MSESSSSSSGCGCVGLIVLILVVTALFWGLPTPWGKFNLDLFPPRIWDMNATPTPTPAP